MTTSSKNSFNSRYTILISFLFPFFFSYSFAVQRSITVVDSNGIARDFWMLNGIKNLTDIVFHSTNWNKTTVYSKTISQTVSDDLRSLPINYNVE